MTQKEMFKLSVNKDVVRLNVFLFLSSFPFSCFSFISLLFYFSFASFQLIASIHLICCVLVSVIDLIECDISFNQFKSHKILMKSIFK